MGTYTYVYGCVIFGYGFCTRYKYDNAKVGACLRFPKYLLNILLTHTIRKYKKMAGQNTFQILLLNDANMIGQGGASEWRVHSSLIFENHKLVEISNNSNTI